MGNQALPEKSLRYGGMKESLPSLNPSPFQAFDIHVYLPKAVKVGHFGVCVCVCV